MTCAIIDYSTGWRQKQSRHSIRQEGTIITACLVWVQCGLSIYPHLMLSTVGPTCQFNQEMWNEFMCIRSPSCAPRYGCFIWWKSHERFSALQKPQTLCIWVAIRLLGVRINVKANHWSLADFTSDHQMTFKPVTDLLQWSETSNE